jgi:lysophospholipase L1-like esterase
MIEAHRGMVDSLAGLDSGPTEAEIAFARAYLKSGDMDPLIWAQAFDPERLAERAAAEIELRARDWPRIGQYRDANAALAAPPKAVFMGDSITEAWVVGDPEIFVDGIIGRGISGQTSPQHLLRFMPDVVALKPRCVHILSGVNDIAGNTGPTTPIDYRNNILAMLVLAEANDIRVILASLLPAAMFLHMAGIDPRPRIAELNGWLQETAASRGHIHADYHSVLDAGDGSMKADLTRDGLHPTEAGYLVMRPVAKAALKAALG